MRSDSKIPPLWTIVNWRQYIEFVWVKYISWHKRNFIRVKCLECWLESEIESKWFWNHWCKCNQSKSIKDKHWFSHRWRPIRNRFYRIWNWIQRRCKDKKSSFYYIYWWKWVVCEWESFEEFRDDMRESYQKHVEMYWDKQTSIDRIDVNWNYCKSNCRRATVQEQNFNKTNTNFVEIDWEKITAVELAEKCWITVRQASDRISKFLHWKISYSNLILYWCHWKKKIWVTIDWKKYCANDISKITWCCPRESRRRFKKYRDWQITKEQLFAPKRYTSIYPPVTTPTTPTAGA